MWPLEGAMIQSLCVDWRRALRCVWSVYNITRCDIITSESNQFPLVLSLKKSLSISSATVWFVKTISLNYFPGGHL